MGLSKLPYQRLTEEEKKKQYGSIEEWGKHVFYALDGEAISGYYSANNLRYDKKVNMDLADGKLNPADFEHLIEEYRLNAKKAPSNLKNYPIVTNIIYALIGDKIARPLNFRVVQTNYATNDIYDDEKKRKTVEMAINQIKEYMSSIGLIPPDADPAEIKTPEDVERYMQYDWKDIREVTAQDSLNYLIPYLRLKHEFKKGFKHLLSTGESVFYTGVYSNNPSIRVCNPLNIEWDKSPENDRIEKANWVKEEEWLTPADIYDRYYEELDEKEIDIIESIKGNSANYGNTGTTNTSVPIYYDSDRDNGYSSFNGTNNNDSLVRVCHLEWASLRKIGIYTYLDEFDIQQKDIIYDTKFKVPEGVIGNIEWLWIKEYWEATRIDKEIFINIRPLPNQKRDLDNLSEASNNYVGVCYDYCVVELLKPYQYLYNVVMFHFEKAISLAKGRALLFDVAQIPVSHGFDLEKWMYYLNTANIAFINSAEETKRGDRASQYFNQFTTLDMSLSNSIQYYVNILDKIELAAQTLVGVTRQRLAAIQTSELVGNTERAVAQSSLLTEHLYEVAEDLERRVLEALLENAKLCWIEGKKAKYVLDSGELAFLNVDGAQFINGSYGVFLSNTNKDKRIFTFLEQHAAKALEANKVNLSNIIDILNKDNVTNAVKTLEQAEQLAQQQAQEINKEQLELQKQELEFQKSLQERELDIKELAIRDGNITKIQSAQIMAMSRQQDQDQDDDGLPDQFEIVKLDLDRQKLEAQKLKDRMDYNIKKEKNSIDRIKANNKPVKPKTKK
jgi:hypothetical protein